MMRSYNLTPAEMGTGVGIVFLASSILGILISGVALKFLEVRHASTAPIRLYVVAFLLSILPGLLLPLIQNLILAYVVMTIQFSLIFAAVAHNFSIVQELSPASARGQASGFFAVSVAILPSFSPVLVGLLSDSLDMGPKGLIIGVLTVSIPAYLLGALILNLNAGAFLKAFEDANSLNNQAIPLV
jgi:MFS family permease